MDLQHIHVYTNLNSYNIPQSNIMSLSENLLLLLLLLLLLCCAVVVVASAAVLLLQQSLEANI